MRTWISLGAIILPTTEPFTLLGGESRTAGSIKLWTGLWAREGPPVLMSQVCIPWGVGGTTQSGLDQKSHTPAWCRREWCFSDHMHTTSQERTLASGDPWKSKSRVVSNLSQGSADYSLWAKYRPFSVFVSSPKWEQFLHFFSDWKKESKEYYFMTWKLHVIHISMSINRVLLEHSHGHAFTYCLWYFDSMVAELSSDQKLHILQRWKYLLFGSLQKKFGNPWSEERRDMENSKCPAVNCLHHFFRHICR